MEFDKKDVEHSRDTLAGLLGYSERMGLVSDINEQYYCKKEEDCPAKHMRMCYEAALKTAIAVLDAKLSDC